MDNSAQQTNLHEGHRGRMRERFLQTGFDGFNDHQILEMFLFYAYPRIDTNEIAHNLINKFGSLNGVLDASAEELVKVGGITLNAAVLLKMIPKATRIYCSARAEEICYDNTEKLKSLFIPCYFSVTEEVFRAACFDNSLRLISNSVICKGSPSGAPVNMRRLMEVVFAAKAPFIAIAHNHPDGSPFPSDSDIIATRNIINAMRSVDVKVLDHIIVGANEALSMRRQGTLGIFD
ncbi:MAG: hypothetical protein MRZ61_01150 [Oscillospiraceae bacterium]|nr:hypothetical protein [Oscillospiraceae bacterium]